MPRCTAAGITALIEMVWFENMCRHHTLAVRTGGPLDSPCKGHLLWDLSLVMTALASTRTHTHTHMRGSACMLRLCTPVQS